VLPWGYKGVPILIRAIGHDKASPTRILCDEYLKRCRRKITLQTHEAAGDIRRERQWLGASLPSSALIVALDARGMVWNSEQLADWLEKAETAGKDVVFLIGGSEGLGELALPEKEGGLASVRLSLGGFTLPHLLARAVLCEQLYRAECITRGHPYHK
jgi:23S rRNA (pseudouridine1915-N3)-methyltransferase